MAEHSAIEWTDATWNPVTGCTKVSPACANCYIERTIPFRTKRRVFVKGHIPLEFHRNRLSQPLNWAYPRMVFVNSLSDLFHPDVPATFIAEVFAVMQRTPQHTYQVLTKRADRMLHLLGDPPSDVAWPLPNVWLGVSVENQTLADARIPLLLQTPAAVRFLSCEPLLGPLNLTGYVSLNGKCFNSAGYTDSLDWVIAGGESGPRVRPTRIEWARSLRDQCVAAGVPFFWKQNGGRTSKSGGRLLDGRTWDEMPCR